MKKVLLAIDTVALTWEFRDYTGSQSIPRMDNYSLKEKQVESLPVGAGGVSSKQIMLPLTTKPSGFNFSLLSLIQPAIW